MPGEPRSAGFWYWLRVVTIGRRPKRTLLRLVTLIAVCFVVFRFVLIPIRVTGISMEPTFHDGNLNLINRLAYAYGQPQRGDVAGLRFTTNSTGEVKTALLKRLVALPGDTISFADGHVCINGDRQEEPYLKKPSNWNIPPQLLGPDDYYFVGDNRSMPPSDHAHGVASRSQILGRVLIKGHD
jgi:signal peptidase I